MTKYIITLVMLFRCVIFSCGQNMAMYLTICNNNTVIVYRGGGIFPKESLTEFENRVTKKTIMTNVGPYEQTNQFIILNNTIGLNRHSLKYFFERINKNSGLGVMKLNIDNDELKTSLIMVKESDDWVVYKIKENYKSDDWCGVDWQFEYYEKINNHILMNDRLTSTVEYVGPLYLALMEYFKHNINAGENALLYSDLNYACGEYVISFEERQLGEKFIERLTTVQNSLAPKARL